MIKSTKIWLGIAGCLLVILGIVCICKPAGTLFATAWLIGCFTFFSGLFKLIFTFRTEGFLPNSGSRMLSAILQILLGCFFLFFSEALTLSLPVAFAIWVLLEGVIIAVQSFDYKRVGFPYWWVILLLGVAGAVLDIPMRQARPSPRSSVWVLLPWVFPTCLRWWVSRSLSTRSSKASIPAKIDPAGLVRRFFLWIFNLKSLSI